MLHEVCQDEGTLEERLAVDCARVVNLGMLKGGDRKMQMNGCPEGHVSRFAHAALVVHIDTKNQEFSEKKSKVDVWLEIGMEPVSLLSSNTSTLSSVVDQP